MKPTDQLAAAFQEAGVDLEQPVTCTCGTGALPRSRAPMQA